MLVPNTRKLENSALSYCSLDNFESFSVHYDLVWKHPVKVAMLIVLRATNYHDGCTTQGNHDWGWPWWNAFQLERYPLLRGVLFKSEHFNCVQQCSLIAVAPIHVGSILYGAARMFRPTFVEVGLTLPLVSESVKQLSFHWVTVILITTSRQDVTIIQSCQSEVLKALISLQKVKLIIEELSTVFLIVPVPSHLKARICIMKVFEFI